MKLRYDVNLVELKGNFGAMSQRLSDEFRALVRSLSGYIKSEIYDANVSLG